MIASSPVALDDQAANLALARASITGEQRRPIEDNGEARTFRLHLRDQTRSETHRNRSGRSALMLVAFGR
jgi:hypothetical protein